jgi:hypothetical protein
MTDFPRRVFLIALLLGIVSARLGAEEVVLKNGGTLRGEIERDNAIVSVFDGLKRTILRDSKIQRIQPEPPQSRQAVERFTLIQPIQVHGGSMPSHALGIRSTPWDAAGQRMFGYSYFLDSKTRKSVEMKQAINELGPDFVRFRGIDGFWQGYINTSQIPREVMLGLLGQINQEDENERLRVARFLIQAKWYPEARDELDRLAKDFPEREETVENVRQLVRDLEARQALAESEALEKGRQPQAAEAVLKTFSREGVSDAALDEIDARLKELATRKELAKAMGADLRSVLDAQSAGAAATWKDRCFEILQGLDDVPEIAAGRLAPFMKSREEAAATPESRLALAATGWALGADHALDDLPTADGLWGVRGRLAAYLAETDAEARRRLIDEVRKTTLPGKEAGDFRAPGLDEATWLVQNLPPPRADGQAAPVTPLVRRVLDDPNPAPSEYVVVLPPEYHPLRSYPALVVLQDGRGIDQAVDRWKDEAGRQGYILIVPDYMTADARPDYKYSPDEHAAVLLSLRDAKKRYAVDSDRVFLTGDVLGGHATWDIGLAHPDVFAGIIPISGLPAKYVNRTRDHVEFVPLNLIIGELATASTHTTVFEPVKAMMSKTWDVTYNEYFRRGLEDFPEETPAIFDWMARRSRPRDPKEFVAKACRPGDDRFFGIVVREFAPGAVVLPEVVDVPGQDLKPATIERKWSTTANLISLTLSGINAIDVWLPPEGLDYDQKIQIRVNGRRQYLDLVKPDLGAFLEDVRLRGDRQQVYWAKVPLGGKGG